CSRHSHTLHNNPFFLPIASLAHNKGIIINRTTLTLSDLRETTSSFVPLKRRRMAAIPPHIQVVFFQGIFSTLYQIERTADSLFSHESIRGACPEKDLDEIVPFQFTLNPFHVLHMSLTWLTGRSG